MSVQTPLQLTWPGIGHATGRQVLLRHCVPPGQTRKQAPQLLLSVEVSKQKPPQFCRGGAQTVEHMPPTQDEPGAHCRPHWPQLSGLESRLTQVPLQLVCPGPHIVRQEPATQTPPEPQEMPQPPQLLASFWMSTHEAPQSTSGRPQLPGTQRLARQRSFGMQALPQPPQLFRSEVVSVQTPLHNDWFGRQLEMHWPI